MPTYLKGQFQNYVKIAVKILFYVIFKQIITSSPKSSYIYKNFFGYFIPYLSII